MTASFSVITPSFNQGQFVRTTIESVLKQEIIDLQYLVIDGGSEDGTIRILKDYSDRLTFVSEPDQGTADAINKGLERCDGELIGWLNSDDIYYPGTLSRVRELFSLHPEADVIYGRADHIDAGGDLLGEYPTGDWAFEDLLNHCIISQPAAFFRRAVVQKFGLLDKRCRYCLDYEFWIRLLARLIFHCLLADLRWNRRISRSTIRLLATGSSECRRGDPLRV